MDRVLRGARVVDGSGGPSHHVDVGIEDGRIVAVGDVSADGAEVVDLDGLVLAPGFVDIHTHLDAQVLWDPEITPCSWYGVTSVVIGSCGFGFAPTRPDHREAIARIMETVEDMSFECLQAGIPWDFESYPEYLDAVDRVPKRINVASMIGHSPLRLYVLGDDADERVEATPAELEQMRAIVDEALAVGAVGFATSRFPSANGRDGKPVPSRLATIDEYRHLAEAVRDAGHGVLMAAVGPGLSPGAFARIAADLGVPATWGPWAKRIGKKSDADMLAEIRALGATVLPQFLTRPMTAQLNLLKPFFFAVSPVFKEVMKAPFAERAAIYGDAGWRDRARPEIGKGYRRPLSTAVISLNASRPELEGRRLADIASERDVEPFDAMVDIALADNLETRFHVTLANDDESWIVDTLNSADCAVGLGDAGAHAVQLCDACQPPYVLGRLVRDAGAVSLEHAVWRFSRQPADLFGFTDRGRIEMGAIADPVAFDLATVGVGEPERAFDLPAGSERLIIRATGVEHVWVNGTAIRRDGADVASAYPGTLLRG